MKKLLVIAVLMLSIASCTKDSKVEVKQMTVEQLKINEGIDLIGAWEIQFGAVARISPNGKSKKPEKTDVINLIDGSISFDGTTFTTSDNPKFAGVNNQTTIISICNWFFSEGGPAQTLTCTNATGSGSIMAWDTDWSENVYRSNLKTIP